MRVYGRCRYNHIMKIDLAGPDVFRPDAQEYAEQSRALCRQFGFEPLTPLDHPETDPKEIYEANIALIRKAQIVVANLNPFRGTEPDSGTVFEVGYALALGKKVFGYVASEETCLERVRRMVGVTWDGCPTDPHGMAIENFGLTHNLMLAVPVTIVVGDLEDCLKAIRPRPTA